MFSRSLDLSSFNWEAKQNDNKIIEWTEGAYETIDRDKLESFSLTYRNKPILEVKPFNRTLVLRLKSWNRSFVLSGKTENIARFWIIAMLAKPLKPETAQHVQCEFDPKFEKQCYDIDFGLSSIYYFFENGKHEVQTKFGRISPYSPIHLRQEEFKHLMGIEDPTKRKI